MAGNRVVEVELVGPRAGQSCVLAGFEFVDGVAQVQADASSALDILATYHSAYPRDSRAYEAAQAKWEENQRKGSPAGGKQAPSGEEVERLQAQLDEARREREEMAARLARAEAAAKSGSVSAAELPAPEAQEKAPKAAKAK